MKLKKRRKSSRMHGKNMGTHGGGARVNRKKSGNKGGVGMAGSGKRGDQKKTSILKKYGNKYFGKKGVTRGNNFKNKGDKINVGHIDANIESYGKKVGDKWEVDAKDYKILGAGKVKNKLIINAKSASKSSIEKVKKSGGEIILPKGKIEKKEKVGE